MPSCLLGSKPLQCYGLSAEHLEEGAPQQEWNMIRVAPPPGTVALWMTVTYNVKISLHGTKELTNLHSLAWAKLSYPQMHTERPVLVL